MTCDGCGFKISKTKNTPDHNYWQISTKDGNKIYCRTCRPKQEAE